MNNLDISFRIAYLNCRGQTGFTVSKQLQVENFIKTYDVDILHLQECHIETDTFSSCRLINSSFTIIHNNSSSKYGTASLVKSTLPVEDIILHHSGRIIFSILDLQLLEMCTCRLVQMQPPEPAGRAF